MSKKPKRRTQLDENLVREGMGIGASADEVRRIHASVKHQQLPADVRSFEVKFGTDATGDPAVWIWFLVDEDNNPSHEKIRGLNRFADKVRSELLKMNLRYWPYIDFRATP
jgi:hypothetical protein